LTPGRDAQHEARHAGLSVTAEDLQAAADAFRRAYGLHTASATRARLEAQGLTAADFETSVLDFQGFTGDDTVRIDTAAIPMTSANAPNFVVQVNGGTGTNPSARCIAAALQGV
jgi:hypothetical protein